MTMNVRDEDGVPANEETLSQKCQEAFASAEQALRMGKYAPRPISSNVRESDEELCLIFQGLFIPAVNELRCAGKHLSDYIVSKNFSDLYEAYSYCIRAKYDAYDCLFQYRLRDVRLFMEQYKSIVIGDVVPNYGNYKKRVNEVLERNRWNAEIQGDYGGESPNSDGFKESVNELEKSADIREADCKTLKKICDKLDSYRDDLNAKLKKERNESFYKLAGLIVAVLTLLLLLR